MTENDEPTIIPDGEEPPAENRDVERDTAQEEGDTGDGASWRIDHRGQGKGEGR